jgi:hypothetical protein
MPYNFQRIIAQPGHFLRQGLSLMSSPLTSDPSPKSYPPSEFDHRVSPAWRIMAILSFLGLIAMTMLVLPVVAMFVLAGRLRDEEEHLRRTYQTRRPVNHVAPFVHTEREMLVPEVEELAYETPVAASAQAFAAIGKEVWTIVGPTALREVVVSNDGRHLAFVEGQHMFAGPIPLPRGIDFDSVNEPPMNLTEPISPDLNVPIVPGEGSDEFIFRDQLGRFYGLNGASRSVSRLVGNGWFARHVPGKRGLLGYLRGRPQPKWAFPDETPGTDLLEIAEIAADAIPSVSSRSVPPSEGWSWMTYAPDGKRLALVKNTGSAGEIWLSESAEAQFTKLDVPPGVQRPLCWSPDGSLLIYCRNYRGAAVDLFQWDLAAKQETRLSRGGNVSSPTITPDGAVFYLILTPKQGKLHHQLVQTTLEDLHAFVKSWPLVQRDAAFWKKFLDDTGRDDALLAGPPPDAGKLTLRDLERLADEALRWFDRRFDDLPPPPSVEFFEEVTAEAAQVLCDDDRDRLALWLGALWGQQLVSASKAAWHLGDGSLFHQPKLESTPLAHVFNPFAAVRARLADPQAAGARRWRRDSAGRFVVLSNDDQAAKAPRDLRHDPDLNQLDAVLKPPRNVDTLMALLNRLDEKHPDNVAVTEYVARRCLSVAPALLVGWLQKQCGRAPRDPRRFNLLGVAYAARNASSPPPPFVGSVPQSVDSMATDAFRQAIRCDRSFEEAYLNLALMHYDSGQLGQGNRIVQQYLERFPEGRLSEAARLCRRACFRSP